MDYSLEHALAVLEMAGNARETSNEMTNTTWEVRLVDPFRNAIEQVMRLEAQIRQKIASDLGQLALQIYHDDRLDTTHLTFDDRHHFEHVHQILATFAALHARPKSLRTCVEQGASLEDQNTNLALDYSTRTAAMLDVLYELDWRGLRSSRSAFERHAAWSLHTNAEEMAWYLTHGAYIDRNIVRRAIYHHPMTPACIALLITRNGVRFFQQTRLLQNSAKRGSMEIVSLLLEAGADVDEVVPRGSDEMHEIELSALYEAVYEQRNDIIRLLLRHGANPDGAIERDGQRHSPRALAYRRGHTHISALFDESDYERTMALRSQAARL